jgi:nucleotide-binding universal stress UspA family protein
MPLYRRILCAIDFSEHSKRALRLSTELANRVGARVSTLHVIDFLLAEAAAVAYDVERLTQDADRELRALVSEVAGPASNVEIAIRTGRADREIVAYAGTVGADVIVVGTQGLGGVRKLLFGSVTERVLRAAKVPVLAVPHDEGRPAEPVRISAIVAGLDLDDETDAVAAHAAALAQELGVPLTLMHAIPHGPLAPYAVDAFGQAMAALRSQAERKIEAVALGYTRQVTVMTEVRLGAAAEEIAALASALPNALAVIGLGGGGLLHRPGSTAYRVLSLAETPVVAVPARRSETALGSGL